MPLCRHHRHRVGAVALHFLFNPDVGLLGASGAIYGVSLVSALNSPDARVYFLGIFPPVRAKYLMGYSAVATLGYVLSPVSNNVAYEGHLGGMVAGLIYLKYMRADSRSGAPGQPVVTPPILSSALSSGSDMAENPSEPGSLDIRRVERVTRAQATQGGNLRITTGSGDEVDVMVPPGTTSGTHLRVPGRGHRQGNQVGDLWVRIKVED